MSEMIVVNVSRMFGEFSPCVVFGSIGELGSLAAQITWGNARAIAGNSSDWLESDLTSACSGMREYWRACGADDWADLTETDCLGLLTQCIAADLRLLGTDSSTLEECVERYDATDWNDEPEYPRGSFYMCDSDVMCEFYTGM